MANRRGLFWTLAALSAFGPLGLDLYLPALPDITTELNASQTSGQLTLSACLIGMALGQIVFGPWSDRAGRRLPMMVAVFGFILAGLLLAISPTIHMLIAVRLFQGLMGSGGVVIARAVVRDVYQGREAARALGIMMAIVSAVPAIAPLFGAQMLRLTSWRGVFASLSVLGVIVFILVLEAARDTQAGVAIARVPVRVLPNRGRVLAR